MRHFSILIFFLLIQLQLYSQSNAIEEDWVKMDSIFLNQVKNNYKSNPLSIEELLQPEKDRQIKLGYGYSLIEASIGKGYVSIFYMLIYKEEKLIAYRLIPQMPTESEIYTRYIKFYDKMFEIKNNKPEELYYNFQEMSKPVEDYKSVKEYPFNIQHFMTPFSGITYGMRGGIAGSVLDNRKAFNSVKKLIDQEVLLLLLHAINPATRLCAAEYYFQNKNKFTQKDLIEKLINKNFEVLPDIDTMDGCMKHSGNAKSVLKQMIKTRD